MKGFIVGLLIVAFVLGSVIFSSAFAEARLSALYNEAQACKNAEDYEAVKEKIEKLYPFLCAISPDDLLREVEVSLAACITAGEEAEKSRLLLALSELRRQAGVSPISVL